MRSYYPDLCLAQDLPPGFSGVERLGGLPFGLPKDRWPTCADCGKHQTFLAQFVHDPERLDLGRTGRMLFVFQCDHNPGMCETWAADCGANACFVMEPEDSTDRPTTPPSPRPNIDRELLIKGWLVHEDGIEESYRDAFFNDADFLALPGEVIDAAAQITRLGGVPAWLQCADDGPREDWRFVGQLDSTHHFRTPPSGNPDGIQPAGANSFGWSSCCQGPNFGDGGIAYLFIRPKANGVPDGLMFWQCC